MRPVLLDPAALFQGPLVCVDAGHPCRTNPRLVPVGGEDSAILLEAEAARQLEALMETLGGWTDIVPVSGWRSQQEQQRIWDDALAEHGPVFTATYVAKPGCSEHQSGLAIDLGLAREDVDFLCPDFPYEGPCQRFRDLAPSFGFVQRYPAGKEPVTGIGHEPWHFRYVGLPHARLLAEEGLTLDEYPAFLSARTSVSFSCGGRTYRISYHKADPGQPTRLEPDPRCNWSVSGDNGAGFILTEWRDVHARDSTLWQP